MKKTKTIPACLLALLWAGCSSVPAESNDIDHSKTADSSPKAVRYHYEVVTEYYDGGTSFLELVPDQAP